MTAQQAMRTAWQIRRAAAAKYGVKVSEIMFAPCLKMAWQGKMTITKQWTTPAGTQVIVTGKLITSKQVYLDGDISQHECCDITIDVTANGASQGSWVRPLPKAPRPELTHVVGRLPLTAEQVALIQSVRAELEQHPLWQAKIAKGNANAAAIHAYEKALNDCKGGYADRNTF